VRDVRLQTMASSRTRAGDAKAIKALEVKLSLAVPVAQYAPRFEDQRLAASDRLPDLLGDLLVPQAAELAQRDRDAAGAPRATRGL
jgi:hypothetical protein